MSARKRANRRSIPIGAARERSRGARNTGSAGTTQSVGFPGKRGEGPARGKNDGPRACDNPRSARNSAYTRRRIRTLQGAPSPRPSGRGLIEAPGRLPARGRSASTLPGLRAGASLKRELERDGGVLEGPLPGLRAGASLKRVNQVLLGQCDYLSPRPSGRGLIEASEGADPLNPPSVSLPGLRAGASLKRAGERGRAGRGVPSPRPSGRGLIEAYRRRRRR